MISKFVLLAGLAVLTQAFLIPPEISSSDTKLIDTLPIEAAIEAAIEATSHALNLECIGCPAPSIDAAGNKAWESDVDSQLKLFFSVQHSNDGDFLTLNNHQIYPPTLMTDPLTAVQVAKGDVGLPVLVGYELMIHGSVKAPEDPKDNLMLIPITLQVLEVGNLFVNGLQSVEIQLLKTADGSLLIMEIDTADTKNPLINPAEKGEKCKTIICKLRATVSQKVGKFRKTKGCGSKKLPEKVHKPKLMGARPHGGPNRYQRKHHWFARVLCAIKKVTLHVMLPIFVGLAVGVAACFMGRMVGSMVVFLWQTFYRGGQRGTYSKVQHEDKIKVLVVEESPPAYNANVDEKAAL